MGLLRCCHEWRQQNRTWLPRSVHLNKKKLYLNGSHVCTYFSKDKESHVSQIFRVKLPPSQAIPPNIPSQTYLLFWYKVFLKDSIVQPRQTRSGTNNAQTYKEGEAILFTLHQWLKWMYAVTRLCTIRKWYWPRPKTQNEVFAF